MTNASADNVIAFPNRMAQVAEEKRIARGEGTKYERYLDITKIAKLVRADLKVQLPGYMFSVRTKRFSGGQSLTVDIKGLPEGVVLLNEAHLAWEKDHPHDIYQSYPEEARSRYSADVKAAIQVIHDIVGAYNHDRSDTMTDYFDVNFYTHIGVDWMFEKEMKQA